MSNLAKKIKGKLRHEKRKLNDRFLESRLGYVVSKCKNRLYFWFFDNIPGIVSSYRKIKGVDEKDFLNRRMKGYSTNNKDFFVFQIGVNDGYENDRVHKFIKCYNWSGILLEPQPQVFSESLSKVYSGDDSIQLLNVALGEVEGILPFFKIAFSTDRWATGLSSFDPYRMKKLKDSEHIQERARRQGVTLPEDENQFIEQVDIPTTTFKNIFNKNNIKKIDLLKIDAEGFDYEFLKLLPFTILKTTFINLEYTHLRADLLVTCQNMLEELSCEITKGSSDILCELKIA